MLEIIYEDNHLLVLNKPAGLLTQPSGTDQNSLETIGKEHIKEKFHKPGNVFLEAAHRIDKPVSGVVLFARTSKALSRLQESMREKVTKKLYFAFVEGMPKQQTGVLEHYLVHDDYKALVVTKDTPGSKLARLHYNVIDKREAGALLEIVLETGRYHQIRAQLSAIGCPIVGDEKYGSKSNLHGVIALHHYKLQIPHPVTENLMTFTAPLPNYWKF